MRLLAKQLIFIPTILCIVRLSSATSLIDFLGVEFQDGKPTPTSILEDSVKLPVEKSIAILEQAADTLRRHPELKIRIVGFTDDQECIGTSPCQELSRRRATLVYEWLLTHGVLSVQVTSVEGIGDQPIDFSPVNDMRNSRCQSKPFNIRNPSCFPFSLKEHLAPYVELSGELPQ